jgi:hypothetical protein
MGQLGRVLGFFLHAGLIIGISFPRLPGFGSLQTLRSYLMLWESHNANDY